LTPEIVDDAVRKVRTFGVESAPGKKDAAKVRAFIQAVCAA
jgi:phosphoribosylanthranilate isomerase